MPVFILPIGERPSAPRTFSALDYFTQAYVEAMFWTDCNSDCEELEGATFSDLACDALNSIMADCEAFQRDHAALLEQAYQRGGYDETQAGHDFWLTRNHHGAGFWDRRELEADGLGDKLTDAAHLAGEVSLYRGDDGRVHL